VKHTISVLVENKPGVLARVAGLFARRGFNIDSLAVSTTERADTSRMTVVAEGDERTLEQIVKQLYKLIDVIKVFDHTGEAVVDRELALIKVKADKTTRSEIMQIADIFRAQIVDVAESVLTVQCAGTEQKIDSLIRLLEGFGVLELVRTGKVVLARGAKPT
jgi:acetolactate synthase-1/3 small subunit